MFVKVQWPKQVDVYECARYSLLRKSHEDGTRSECLTLTRGGSEVSLIFHTGDTPDIYVMNDRGDTVEAIVVGR